MCGGTSRFQKPHACPIYLPNHGLNTGLKWASKFVDVIFKYCRFGQASYSGSACKISRILKWETNFLSIFASICDNLLGNICQSLLAVSERFKRAARRDLWMGSRFLDLFSSPTLVCHFCPWLVIFLVGKNISPTSPAGLNILTFKNLLVMCDTLCVPLVCELFFA